jgi:Raf kinase inhibitor-like YbhB/YbcL family protein
VVIDRIRFGAGAVLISAVVLFGGCGGGDKPSEPLPRASAAIDLSSPAFRNGGTIPKQYTCSGEDVSPPLRWSGLVGGGRELELLVEDVDADRYVHWTLLGIASDADHLAEGKTPAGTVQTENGFGDTGWGGPCPPEGHAPHRYVFALYEVDAPLGLGKDASPDDVRSAIAKHAVAVGRLTGRFGR